MKKRFCKPLHVKLECGVVDITRGGEVVSVYSEEEAWQILEELNKAFDLFEDVE